MQTGVQTGARRRYIWFIIHCGHQPASQPSAAAAAAAAAYIIALIVTPGHQHSSFIPI
jgi:hypothetical protein